MAARCASGTGIGVGGAGATSQAHKPIWPSRCDDLRHLAAHRMADQYVPTQPDCARNSLGVVSHGAKIVSPICRNGTAPTTLIESDRVRPAAEPTDHILPCA
jgi:hypothetical protein